MKEAASSKSIMGSSGEVIIDGEVVVVHVRRANLSELQAELAAGKITRCATRRKRPRD